MVAEDIPNPKFSKFSLAVLKDSNWYDIQMDKAEKIEWGKAEGCSFLNKINPTLHSEFCQNEGELRCSDDLVYATECILSKYSNRFVLNQDSLSCVHSLPASVTSRAPYESFGRESLCQIFEEGAFKKSGCARIQCQESGSEKYSVIVTVDEQEKVLECSEEGQKLAINASTHLICSKPSRICNRKLECPGNCHWRGFCLEDGSCLCHSFYSGSQCETFVDCAVAAAQSRALGSFFQFNSEASGVKMRSLGAEEESADKVKEVCLWVKNFNNVDPNSYVVEIADKNNDECAYLLQVFGMFLFVFGFLNFSFRN